MPFKFLMLFTLVLFLRPQELYPPLSAIPFAKIIGIAGLFSFLISKTNNIPEIVKTREFKVLIALIVLIIITTPFGLWPGGSFHKFTNVFTQVFLIFLLIAGTVDTTEKVNKLLWIMMLGTFVVALLGIYDYSSGESFAGNRLYARVGLYGDPNDFAVTLAVMIPFAIYLLRVNKPMLKRIVLIATMGIYLTSIILTYSRTGFLALVAISVGIIVKGRKKFTAFIILMVVFGLIFVLAPSRFQDRAASIFYAQKDEDGSRAARIAIIWRGLEILFENPILGVGLGNFEIAEGMKRGLGQWKTAHNGYVQIAAELGILGFILFIALLYLTITEFRHLQRVFLSEKNSRDSLCLFEMLEVSLWVYMITNVFLSTTYSWIFFYLMGFSVAFRFRSAKIPITNETCG